MSVDDTLVNIPVTLEEHQTYVAIANGVLDPGSFAMNPNGKSIGFQLFPRDHVRESARWSWTTDLLVFHGATDAPTVDVRVRELYNLPLVNDLSYGQFAHYRPLLPRKYTLDITPGDNRDVVVATFLADLTGLRGGAAVVFASGFLSPADNQGGAAFGLFAALPDGAVVPLPSLSSTARLQVIHNAADPAAASVDIYVNGGLYEDDFNFRSATEFRTVPAGVALNIGIAPGTSGSADDTIANIPVTLEPGKTYVAVANGVLSPADFKENPNGKSIGFALYPRDGVRESSIWPWTTKLIAFHGATDAPAVDIYARHLWGRKKLLFGGLMYGDFSSYRTVGSKRYVLDVTPAGDRRTVVASFEADLRGLGGGTAVVFASGFLSPSDNQGGEAFGLFAALPDGRVIPLQAQAVAAKPEASDALLPTAFRLDQNFPNPFNPTTSIAFALPEATDVSLKVYNVLGQEIVTLVDRQMEAGEHEVEFDARAFASGMYFYRLEAGTEVETRKMTLMK
jgi:hypothetical protein